MSYDHMADAGELAGLLVDYPDSEQDSAGDTGDTGAQCRATLAYGLRCDARTLIRALTVQDIPRMDAVIPLVPM